MPEETGGHRGNFLTRKVGPLPTWAYIVGGGVVFWFVLSRGGRGASTPAFGSAIDPSVVGGAGGLGVGPSPLQPVGPGAFAPVAGDPIVTTFAPNPYTGTPTPTPSAGPAVLTGPALLTWAQSLVTPSAQPTPTPPAVAPVPPAQPFAFSTPSLPGVSAGTAPFDPTTLLPGVQPAIGGGLFGPGGFYPAPLGPVGPVGPMGPVGPVAGAPPPSLPFMGTPFASGSTTAPSTPFVPLPPGSIGPFGPAGPGTPPAYPAPPALSPTPDLTIPPPLPPRPGGSPRPF